ncbi:pyruvate/2-oxoglutarate dehydrogenase complex dihydrolipoamide dehydrogenase (E3) component [Arthrobacter stackebrandtii]|uniref:Pyruvate/2-oxoglutarate dehydrogenase complex dihydrolipoamide dehydrogenase (E3) component n=1 Tax=Arthrobacter stackebrandtii TaxID=272161 RepID=A0ABS4YZK9_9MICC|nr:hypothetical protein [Arthrobacter stackebrandtii]MBP2414226.1 pyruvate/2-oxoglutarate dehydrogenase complex dihydrolipoamide dehydrogenase (E3) component [Arthrobacter stackebrandtii]
MLIATGLTPNADRLAVDRYHGTSVEGIFALGDISGSHQLKHVVNHESRVVKHNLIHPTDLIAAAHRFVPAAVFSDPQIASIGLTEQQAAGRGVSYVAIVQKYADITADWARRHSAFPERAGRPGHGHLLGAHVIGPEAATIIQPLTQAMSFDQSAHQVARGQYWIHPALSKLVENA